MASEVDNEIESVDKRPERERERDKEWGGEIPSTYGPVPDSRNVARAFPTEIELEISRSVRVIPQNKGKIVN